MTSPTADEPPPQSFGPTALPAARRLPHQHKHLCQKAPADAPRAEIVSRLLGWRLEDRIPRGPEVLRPGGRQHRATHRARCRRDRLDLHPGRGRAPQHRRPPARRGAPAARGLSRSPGPAGQRIPQPGRLHRGFGTATACARAPSSSTESSGVGYAWPSRRHWGKPAKALIPAAMAGLNRPRRAHTSVRTAGVLRMRCGTVGRSAGQAVGCSVTARLLSTGTMDARRGRARPFVKVIRARNWSHSFHARTSIAAVRPEPAPRP